MKTLEEKKRLLAMAEVVFNSSNISEEEKQPIREFYSELATEYVIESALGKEALEMVLWCRRMVEKRALGY